MADLWAFAGMNPGYAFLMFWVAAWMIAKVAQAFSQFHPFARVVNHHHYSECSCNDDDDSDNEETANDDRARNCNCRAV